jgi:hypothetical protein
MPLLLEEPYTLLAAGTTNGQKATKLRDLLSTVAEKIAERLSGVIRLELR